MAAGGRRSYGLNHTPCKLVMEVIYKLNVVEIISMCISTMVAGEFIRLFAAAYAA